MKKHFDNLGLRQDATQSDVKKAYRRLAMRLHPDKNSNPKAPALFSELQYSYEILMDFTDPNRQKGSAKNDQNSFSTYRKEKTYEDRVAEAKKRYYEQKRREEEQNERYFRKKTSGTIWKIYRTGTFLCATLSLILILDLFLPFHTKKDSFTGWIPQTSGGIIHNNVRPVFLNETGEVMLSIYSYSALDDYPDCYVHVSRLLHLPKKIIHPIENELHVYDVDLSLGALQKLLALFFLIPIIVLLHKKKTYYFTLIYSISLYFILPVGVLFLITGYRWLHVLTFGFY